MSRSILYFAVLAFVMSITSCATKLTPFTQNLYQENNWSAQDLQHIQFYLSHDIVLRRQAAGSTSAIERGKIKMVNGREVEEVVFPAGTPGLLVSLPDSDRFAVSFDEGSDEVLLFGPAQNGSGRYVVLAKDWNRRTGKVTYNGKQYTIDTQSAYAALMVDVSRARKVQRKSTEVGGRRL